MITLRPWLDRLLLATLVVTTWHKLHWAPGARRRHARGHPRDRLRRRSSSSIAACAATARMHRVALGLLLAMAVLEAVYLAGYFALENAQQLSQYAKGMAKFALHFALPRVRHAARDRPRRAAAAPHGRRLRRRPRLNCAYGVAQLAAQVGAGVNLDKAVIGPLTFGQGSLGGINVYGAGHGRRVGQLRLARASTASTRSRSTRTTSGSCSASRSCCCCRSRCAPGLRTPLRAWCWPALLAFFVVVELLTLSRSGLLGLACGLLVLAWPLRRQLLLPRFARAGRGARSGALARRAGLVALRRARSSALA